MHISAIDSDSLVHISAIDSLVHISDAAHWHLSGSGPRGGEPQPEAGAPSRITTESQPYQAMAQPSFVIVMTFKFCTWLPQWDPSDSDPEAARARGLPVPVTE